MAYGYVHVQLEGLDSTARSLKILEKHMQEHGISIVAGIGAEARDIAYPAFFNAKGSGTLHYNTPDRARRGLQPLTWRGQEGYVDHFSTPRRLVNFSLESKSPAHKTAYISSIPMNLYEHEAHFKTYTRPGKYIMSVKLPPLVQGVVPKHVAKAELELAAIANADLNGSAV
jgi:hypothetical protein